jgi:hypothetical protein
MRSVLGAANGLSRISNDDTAPTFMAIVYLS